MGEIRTHRPSMLFLAAFSRHTKALNWALEKSVQAFGPLAATSGPFRFNQTSYYHTSMGEDLQKVLWTFESLIDPARLTDLKIRTNQWEEEFRSLHEGSEARPLNLDPGYLTEAKLVLATTKDRDHRIYLQRGIFAEVTLFYHAGTWQTRPWTYPDYQRAECLEFLAECRTLLRNRLREQSDP